MTTKVVTDSYTILATDDVIMTNGAESLGHTLELTLPLAVDNSGKVYHLRNLGPLAPSIGNVVVKTQGNDVIKLSYLATVTELLIAETVVLTSDGTSWYKL
jgi:hypothetical protein